MGFPVNNFLKYQDLKRRATKIKNQKSEVRTKTKEQCGVDG
jgi:hypothetical protein